MLLNAVVSCLAQLHVEGWDMALHEGGWDMVLHRMQGHLFSSELCSAFTRGMM